MCTQYVITILRVEVLRHDPTLEISDRGMKRHHSPCYKILNCQHDFEAVILW